MRQERRWGVLLFLAAALAAGSRADAQTLDEIVARHMAARGLDKLQQAQTERMTSHAVQDSLVKRMVFEVKRPSSWRQTLWLGSTLAQYESWTGSSGWSKSPGVLLFQPRKPAPDDLSASDVMEGALVNFRSKGYSAELTGKKQVMGRDCFNIRIAIAPGKFETICIDTGTYFDVERTTRDGHVVERSDFRDVNGIKFPFVLRAIVPNGAAIVVLVDRYEIDAPLDDSLFSKPSFPATYGIFNRLESVAMARAILLDSLKRQRVPPFTAADATNVQLGDDGYSYQTSDRKTHAVSFSNLAFTRTYLKNSWDVNGVVKEFKIVVLRDKTTHPNEVEPREFNKGRVKYLDTLYFPSEFSATRFIDAMNLIVGSKAWNTYLSDAQEMEEFRVSAKVLQAVQGKDLVGDALKRRVIAENAIKEKNFEEAALNFQLAVTFAPNFAEGWYNAALLHAELKCYAHAAMEMKRYLELMPRAPDAIAARNQMYVWEEKMKQ